MQRLRIAAFTILSSSLIFGQSDAIKQLAAGQAQTGQTSQADQIMLNGASTSASQNNSPRLIIKEFKRPVYPEQAQKQQLQGRVLVHLVIDEKGNVVDAEPVSGDPVLLAAAASAMRAWKFEPYIQNGQAVRVSAKMHYDFAFPQNLHDKVTIPPGPEPESSQQQSVASETSSDSTTKDAVSISAQVSQGLLIHQVAPVYPKSSRQNGEHGTVVLNAIIGKDGLIKNLHVVSSPSDDLAKAAIAAVEQWRYRPYVLNGDSAEVTTVIHINFKPH